MGDIQLNLICGKPTMEMAQARVDELAGRIEDELGDLIYSSQGESLEQIVLFHLEMRGATLATAESCTGGMLAQRLTSVSGSSRSFLGGAVVYSDDLKTDFAGVPPGLSPNSARSAARSRRRWPRAFASAPARRWESALPASPARPAARKRNRWAWSTSLSPMKNIPRSLRNASEATGSESASGRRSRRWTWCAGGDVDVKRGRVNTDCARLFSGSSRPGMHFRLRTYSTGNLSSLMISSICTAMPQRMLAHHHQPLITIQIAKGYMRKEVSAKIALRLRRELDRLRPCLRNSATNSAPSSHRPAGRSRLPRLQLHSTRLASPQNQRLFLQPPSAIFSGSAFHPRAFVISRT